MVIKKNYSKDLVKKRWRKKIILFIKKQYTKEELKNARVLCFPGHEMLEIFEIYDQLEIKRENIIGIEGNKEVYNELNKKNNTLNKKIKIVNSSLEEYLNKKSTRKTFDIICLDYTSYFDNYKSRIFKLLAQKNLLGKKPIIITNYPQGKRTNYLEKNIKFAQEIKNIVNKKDNKEKIVNNLIKYNHSILLDKQNINNSEKFDIKIDSKIQLDPVNCLLEGEKFCESKLFKYWQKKEFYPIFKEDTKKLIKNLKTEKNYENELINYLFFLKESITPKSLFFLITFSELKKYRPFVHNAYKYVSESGSLMVGDFYAFKEINLKEYSNRLLKLLNLAHDKNGTYLKIPEDPKKRKEFRTIMTQIAKEFIKIVFKIKKDFPKKRENLS